MTTRALATVLLLAVLAPAPGDLHAQMLATRARTVATHADSAPLARQARSAQAAFEQTRRAHLPWTTGDGAVDPTHAIHIGRFWYWSDGEISDPPPEPEAIRSRRDALLAVLDRVAATIPGDPWVAGQRVRYLVEAGRADEALAAARGCAAEPSWCLRLAGHALHVAGRFAEADTAFDAALAAMPDSTRCRWLRVGDALEDDLRGRWEHADCSRREGLARRTWRLGAPFYLAGHDELRTAVLARLTRSDIESDAQSPRGLRWGDDLTELTLRYGWSSWFTRSEPPMGSMAPPSVVGHDIGPGFTFVPSAAAVDSAWSAPGSAWPLDRTAARFSYTPAYVRRIHELPHTLAVFRRADTLLLVAAYDVAGDTAFHGRPMDAGLFAIDSAGVVRGSVRHGAGEHGVLELRVPSGAYAVSVEVLDRDDRAGARARYGLGARATTDSVGDLLLVRPGDHDVATLDEALARAYVTSRISRRDRLGLYWELPRRFAGASGTGEVEMSLALEPVRDGGVLRSLARRIGLGDHRRSLRLAWRDRRRSGGVGPRSMALDVGRLAPGRYELRLVARPDDGPVVEARRAIELLP